MSKFCTYCGKELENGQCTCSEFLMNQVTASTPTASVAHTSGNGLVGELLTALKTIGKSKETASQGLSFASMGIFAGASLVLYLLSYLFFFLGTELSELLDSVFVSSLLLGLFTVAYSVVLLGGIGLIKKLANKETLTFSAEWFNFPVINTFYYSVGLLIASLMSFISAKLCLVLMLFVSLISIADIAEYITTDNKTWKQAIKYGIATITTVIFVSIFYEIFESGLILSYGLFGSMF